LTDLIEHHQQAMNTQFALKQHADRLTMHRDLIEQESTTQIAMLAQELDTLKELLEAKDLRLRYAMQQAAFYPKRAE
jgi:hypothetical protein